jgi:molybdenum cofactor cytidylyltransferase
MLAALILSGGASQRMGSPKALLPYQGRPFLEHLLEVTSHPKIGVRRVVLGAHAKMIADAVRLATNEVVINEDWEQGQLSSIHAGIRNLPAGTDGMILCLVDHPLISARLVDELIGRFYRERHAPRPAIVLPVYQGKRGHPVIFSAGVYEELLAAPMDQGARSVVWAHVGQVAEVATPEQGCVLNLNDPETMRHVLGRPG